MKMLFKPSKLIILFIITIYASGCGKSEYKYATINPKCGPQSLQFVMELYGIDSSLEELCALADYTEKSGSSMYGLYKAAEKKGLAPEASKTNLDKLCNNKYPSIVFVNGNHFIVFIGCMKDSVTIFDPPDNTKIISKREFSQRWKGETLFLYPPKGNKSINQDSTSDQIHGPQIKFEKKQMYLGAIESGGKFKFDFNYKNTGTDTLKIIALRTRCSCLDPLPHDRFIPPGASGKISLEFNTEGKSRGLNTQSASVITNDPVNRVTELTIEAVILSEVMILPNKIDLGELYGYQTIKKIIKVKDSGKGDLAIKSIDVPEFMKAEIKPSIENSKGIINIPIELNINAPENLGSFENKIIVTTNFKNKPEFIIPIKGKVVPLINANPPQIVLGNIKAGTEISKKIDLY